MVAWRLPGFLFLLLLILLLPPIPALADIPFAPAPAYDSGWQSVLAAKDVELWHYLGGDLNDYQMYMECRTAADQAPHGQYLGIKVFHGNPPSGYLDGDSAGGMWSAGDNALARLTRASEDGYCPQMRLRIWRAPDPAYDSGVLTPAQGATVTLTHNLGGGVSNLVDLLDQFSPLSKTNRIFIGGAHIGANPPSGHSDGGRVGSAWLNLTPATVQVHRLEEDSYANFVRVRIYRAGGGGLPFMVNDLLGEN